MILRTPQEIVNHLNEKRQSLLKQILAKISAELEKSFVGKPIDIWIYESIYTIEAISLALTTKLAEQGWCFKVGESISSRQDGECVKLTISPIGSIDLPEDADKDRH